MDRSKLKLNLITATYSIILLLVLINLQKVTGSIGKVFSILTPFIYGFIIAYLLKQPYKFFYDKLYRMKRGRKAVALISVYLSFLLAVSIISSIVLPQLATSVNTLVSSLPQYTVSMENFLNQLLGDTDLLGSLWAQFQNVWKDVLETVGKFITTGLPQVIDLLMNITASISNIVIGFVISIYMLASKETLQIQIRKILFAFVPKKYAIRTLEIASLINKTFGDFINGQLTDAFLLGVTCFVGMILFRFPYALLISVIIGLTNIIPIFGPIIGSIPCTFIILMVSPIRALWFIVFVIVLQQIDSNIICPRVVGGSIGLSGLWVMFAILVGGGLFGLPGMIIGVPMFAVFYTLLKQATYKRLQQKNTNVE